ncbi:alpha-L-fucosidase [Cerasicoccus frondis]|uniref:alpha-L-fucosidase n=1 Tax=Cerasicoccus frondis TaxID=490090 RepID=UPI002852674C|nr:alpha-L-fucosidase [Cerasicoccus frondis]
MNSSSSIPSGQSEAAIQSFTELRYGLFVHFGLFSLVGRGEWVMNKESMSHGEAEALSQKFLAEQFDAHQIADLAIRGGMKYIVFTTMHHEGFRLYDTQLSDFNALHSPCGRDLVQEVIDAARARGLKIGLYHSLNNWYDKPDAVDALENQAAYGHLIKNTFARIEELVTRYNPIDVLWYDGWWPFNAEGWQAKAMNAMVREIQPKILFNGRNGLPGDFGTPEGHVSMPQPWRPWEACMTLNDSWGYHAGDHNWKSLVEVIKLLARVAQGQGNLLLNIGPRGDGSIPEASVSIIEKVGQWLETNGECIFDTDPFTFDLQERGDHRGDYVHHGPMTVRGNALYLIATNWPGAEYSISGLSVKVSAVTLLGAEEQVSFEQRNGVVKLSGLPMDPGCELPLVFKFECEAPPSIYKTGGMRVPQTPHPRYDPCPSDIQH